MGHEDELDMRPLVIKRLIWDIYPHDIDLVRDVQSKLGLVPDTDDGLEIEHDASDVRINRVAPLTDALETLAGYAAEVMGHYMVAMVSAHADEDMEVPEGFYEGFARQNGQVIYDGTYAILCHLLATGVLEYGSKFRKKGEQDAEAE